MSALVITQGGNISIIGKTIVGTGGGVGPTSAFWSNWTTLPIYTAGGTSNITVNGNNLEIDDRAGLRTFNANRSYAGGGSFDASNCSNLTSLNVEYNSITTLDVSGCTALTTLACYHNQLSTLDVSGCTALTTLNVCYNQLSTLGVSGCTALTTLACYDNQLSTLDVSGCTALTNLNCFGNKLTETVVNNILTTINGFGTSNGSLSLHGGTNAAPSGAGLTATASLQLRSWSVDTN